LGHNPFPGAPPRYVRALVYDYRFATPAEKRASGDWWKREFKQSYGAAGFPKRPVTVPLFPLGRTQGNRRGLNWNNSSS